MPNKHQPGSLMKSFKLRRKNLLGILLFAVLAGAVLILFSRAESNILGDVNGDERVDITDLSILLSNYGKTAAYDKGDLNSDTEVDIVDLSIVLSHYGRSDQRTITATLNGPEQVVFDWSTQKCEDRDVPDLPARAFRNAAGQVNLITSHDVLRRSTGSTLNNVTRNCAVIMNSHQDPDPSKYNDHEWLAAPYTIDGNTVYALVHNEHHAYLRPQQCPSRTYYNCWFNSVTLATSTNGGQSFSHAAAPNHLVAALPYKFMPDIGFRVGYFEPTNIVKHPTDGFYYSMIYAEAYQQQKKAMCVIRTNNLGDPKSWRAWDGSGYNIQFINPYTHPSANPAQHVCPPVAYNQIHNMRSSLTYNTYLQKFVLVGLSNFLVNGKQVECMCYSTSDDLINWTPRKMLFQNIPTYAWKAGDPAPIWYPSLLDPTSTSRNFETTGQTPYLYYTRLTYYTNGGSQLDRDLIRVPIKFTK